MNTYEWLDVNFQIVLRNLNLNEHIPYSQSLISSDADKCYGYESIWNKKNVPFEHGSALYLISKLPPYDKEVRYTSNGWVAPDKWVIDNYERFKEHLPRIE
ncbi:hypothetical protein FJQ98_16330 [Lysinibacillus agricola]|uniref:Uncharacterized protein n=1 Tax=Lysinibacillus agricola TaxID=2590012 RepID=A0ABX7ALN3_9BACI|nr:MULTISPECIES: hypothetical protein [Lysinibacillus]KOS61498.1 hypothetical protein AN161_18080 [Lysinibacillus sp. FJAT-14222]QQP10812.1 hypothetical protein FJQ98_16330 [Lysinibacillus agricola]